MWVEEARNLSDGVALGDGTGEGYNPIHDHETCVRTRCISELLKNLLDVGVGPVVSDVLQQEYAGILDRVGREEVMR